MQVEEMTQISISVDGGLNEVQQEARKQACEGEGDLRLIAWYDNERGTGGPETACQGEPPKCVRDYAASHGGECQVVANDGEYEFYFSRTGTDVEQLDQEWVVKAREGLEMGDHDNVQGG